MKNCKYNHRIVETGEIEENCVIVKCCKSNKAVIFDPGDDAEKIINILQDMNADPVLILNTHGHYDHIGAIERLRNHFKIPVKAHEKEEIYFLEPDKNYSIYGRKQISLKLDGYVSEKDDVKFGELSIKVIETPGHTLGGVCYLIEDLLIAGDTLFAGSIGRTDLFGGDQNQLLNSINKKLAILPDATIVLPGHGRYTSIGQEKRFNPFLD
ncbi:MAG: MBL fold metallo-hydrolase [Candidatus Delongbacteria bacterium]|nr:MBL fold metallo-hydrolase [Candidatus Delongbacteria bacterium]